MPSRHADGAISKAGQRPGQSLSKFVSLAEGLIPGWLRAWF